MGAYHDNFIYCYFSPSFSWGSYESEECREEQAPISGPVSQQGIPLPDHTFCAQKGPCEYLHKIDLQCTIYIQV